MRLSLAAVAALTLAVVTGCAGTTESDSEDATAGDESEIVGGKRDLRWSASGYLVKASDTSKVKCGATLIAPNLVVTAAHCVLADKTATWAFGTGDAGQGELVKVVATRVHPSFHEEAQGSIDLVHALRKYDVATLTLEKPVRGVAPATLPNDPPSMGCNIQAIGYSGTARMSAPACVMFRITLGRDPIFEVHPAESSALCIRDGDEGSAVVARAPASAAGGASSRSDQESNQQILRGIFVGSVTQGLTDCKRGTQFLNGYESMFGYKDWLNEGIRAAAAAR